MRPRRIIPLSSRSRCELIVALLPLLLGACGDRQLLERNSGVAPKTAPRQFSAEEKRAAKALSLGSEQVAVASSSAYDRALKCSRAFPALSSRLGEGANGQSLAPALEAANSLFDRRLRQAASQEGKSTAQLAEDIKAEDARFADEDDKIRIAVACLRAMT